MVTSLRLAHDMADALGLSDQTVVQHVKNLQKRKLLTSTGRGRGAAHMRPSDAAKLLIAVVGSDLVKDSVSALRAFGTLLPIRHSTRASPHITLEDHMAAMLTEIADEAHAGSEPEAEPVAHLCLSLLSVVSLDPRRFPCVAIARRIRRSGGIGAISFATTTWEKPEVSAGNYAAQMKGAGMIRERHVTLEAMEKIARSL
jgi:hypothetical protein